MPLPDLSSVRNRLVGLLGIVVLMMIGCSSSPGSGDNQLPVSSDDVVSLETPAVLEEMRQEEGLLAPIPIVVASTIRADTGLQVAYTDAAQIGQAPASIIEQQWVDMQQCIEINAAAPVVLVRAHSVTPFTIEDDVVRDIQGIAVASSTLARSLLQISLADFGGTLGQPLFNLRSIMGRYLWLSAALPERDYPFHCASEGA